MGKWFDLFKTGTHKDTTGIEHKISAADLQTIEKRFSELNDDSPLVVGHPETNSPAYGWLKKVKVFGNKLMGMAEDVVPEFADAVNKRMYKKISLSLRPDFSIRHVGFLGAAPPAVKGLIPVPVGCFAEGPGDFTIEFSEEELNFSDGWFVESRIRTLGGIIQRIRDWIIQKDGVEEADKVVDQWAVDQLKEYPPPDKEGAVAPPGGFSEAQTTPERGKEDTTMEVKKPETPVIEKPGEFAERVATLETQNRTLLEENKTLKKSAAEKAEASFVEKLGGKLLPKFKQGIIDLLVNLEAGGLEINFSETEKKPAVQLMRDFLEELPVQVPLKEVGAGADGKDGSSGEFADVETDPERLELHNKAKALSVKEKIPYADAVRRLTNGGK